MIVYGDTEFGMPANAMVRGLQARVEATDPASLDDLRRLLIQAGQVEQALEDANSPDAELARRLTDAVAWAFVCRLRNATCRETFAAVADCCARFRNVPAGDLTVKIPEGFEFYALYPEQYVCSAEQWSQEQTCPGLAVCVVGIRSIGTTLSAVVRAVLKREGWDADRLTVRPNGHPFNRAAVLRKELRCERAIVVDEGPGLSGSSMAAVAQALHGSGVAQEEIFFFPGSEKEPGQFANEDARRWWTSTKRYFTLLDKVKWDGRALVEVLQDRTRELLGSAALETQDFSAGAWRQYLFDDQAEWPAIPAAFERQKFRVLTRSGEALLWKFIGLGRLNSDVPITEQIEHRARLGWTAAPRGSCNGFTALPWIEGLTMRSDDATYEVMEQLAQYIVDAAGPPLESHESLAALERLAFMVRQNTGRECESAVSIDGPSYGDGRMSPHEWLLTADGRLNKTDAHAHTHDHTIVGRQSVLWDVAGVIVEWKLSAEQQGIFLSAVRGRAPTLPVDSITVDFYVRAYAAFRMGLMTLCAESASETEQARLRTAAERYRAQLRNPRVPAIA